jgi:hypothetical protein
MYRASRSYLSRVADFYELRVATARAAEDLYGAGSPEAAAVAEAWNIVGAPRGPHPNPDPTTCEVDFATKPATC